MSNFYLCDQCEWWIKWRPDNFTGLEGRCGCEGSGNLFLKKVMDDTHEHPEEVCPHFQPKIVEKSDIEGESPLTLQHSGRLGS